MTNTDTGQLRKHIGLGHGIALYTSAVLGAGVLVLPGQVASMAGPASLVSWAFACAMGVPLAWLFAALARSFPDAGGVATYVGAAFGPTSGGLAGWLYFVAGSVGQVIVPLTGGYYVTEAFGLASWCSYAVAALILVVATVANLAGVRVSGGAQLVLAGGVAVALLATILAALPRMRTSALTPFAPHGLLPVGAGVIVLFFAFAGWETIAHLAGEFRDADRDVPRAVVATIVVVTVLYIGTAAAVVLTGTYGSPQVDHVSLGLLLGAALGGQASFAAAVIAVVISLGTTNAFIAGVSRLGYSLANDGWLPRRVAHVSRSGVPVGGVCAVVAVAGIGLAIAWARGLGTEDVVVIPSTLVVAVYVLAAAAGVKLLKGAPRTAALATLLLTALVVPSTLRHLLIPAVVVVAALATRAVLARRSFSLAESK